jgi:hypothetical protein
MQKPEGKRPSGVTVLMAIYGEMAIYGQEAAGVPGQFPAPGPPRASTSLRTHC